MPDFLLLNGQVSWVRVTGAAGGIGAGAAKALLAQGVSLALWDIQSAALARVHADLHSGDAKVISRTVDVANCEAVDAAVADVERALGGVDLLVNVAGGNAGTRPSLVEDMPGQDWDRVIDANLSSAFYCVRACAKPMHHRGGGAIVNIASLAAIRMSMHFGASYTAAKAGLLGLTRHAAMDLSPHGIRVNAVLPGAVITEVMRLHASRSTLIEDVPKQVPLGRWVEVEDVANAVLFLCSSASSACTGTHLVVDCDAHIGSPAPPHIYFAQRKKDER